MPLFYKSSYITPLFKKGDRARAVNYRPISLTSHVIKIYERVLRKTMVNFIEDNNILCDNQHGFRSGHSCRDQHILAETGDGNEDKLFPGAANPGRFLNKSTLDNLP